MFSPFGCHSIPVLNTSSSSLFNVSTSWCHYSNPNTQRPPESTGLQASYFLSHKWTLVMHYHCKRQRATLGHCGVQLRVNVSIYPFNLSLCTHHLQPVQVDTKFMETKDFVSSLCLNITLMCSSDWWGKQLLKSLSTSALSSHLVHYYKQTKGVKEVNVYIVVNNSCNLMHIILGLTFYVLAMSDAG